MESLPCYISHSQNIHYPQIASGAPGYPDPRSTKIKSLSPIVILQNMRPDGPFPLVTITLFTSLVFKKIQSQQQDLLLIRESSTVDLSHHGGRQRSHLHEGGLDCKSSRFTYSSFRFECFFFLILTIFVLLYNKKLEFFLVRILDN